MIFEAPQSELVKVDFYLLEPKIKKNPGIQPKYTRLNVRYLVRLHLTIIFDSNSKLEDPTKVYRWDYHILNIDIGFNVVKIAEWLLILHQSNELILT